MIKFLYTAFIAAIFFTPVLASAQKNQVNIGEMTIRYNDTIRQRPLITEVWYPTTDTVKKHNTDFAPFVRIETVKDGKPINKKSQDCNYC